MNRDYGRLLTFFATITDEVVRTLAVEALKRVDHTTGTVYAWVWVAREWTNARDHFGERVEIGDERVRLTVTISTLYQVSGDAVDVYLNLSETGKQNRIIKPDSRAVSLDICDHTQISPHKL